VRLPVKDDDVALSKPIVQTDLARNGWSLKTAYVSVVWIDAF